MQIEVTVTQSDISKGIPRSSTECFAARALKRLFKDASIISVNYDRIRVDGIKLSVPEELNSCLHAYDANWSKYVKPFKFMVDVPDESGDNND